MQERWYGWQSLTIDGTILVTLIAAGSSSTTRGDAGYVTARAALGGYLLGGPVTHFVHGSPSRGLGSLGLRATLPIGFGLLGTQLDSCGREQEVCTFGGAALGMLGAAIIDAAWLGYEKVPVQTSGLTRLGISVDRDAAAIVAGGTF